MAPITKKFILGAIAALLICLAVWSVEEGEKFSCQQAHHQLIAGETLFAVANKYCDGNLQNAVLYIAESNGLKRVDLGNLRVHQVIAVPQS
jgi:hypothetical protein